MLFSGAVDVHCESQTEHTNTLSRKNAVFLYVKAGGTYSDHRASKSSCQLVANWNLIS
jgi:hypothetical protein